MASFRPVTTEVGHSCPPEGPHTITTHLPGWDTAIRFRNGDQTIVSKLRSIYPRFTPFGPARQLSTALLEKLGLPATEKGLLMFTDPATFAAHTTYALSAHRKDDKLTEADLTFYVVDVRGVRLYCVTYPLTKTPGVIGVWQNTGTGLSTRASEELLKHIDSDFALVPTPPGSAPPEPTYLPESPAHSALRSRVRDLLHRAPIDPAKVTVADEDVFLYNTGMAAIYKAHEVLIERAPAGTILALGSLFHNTWHLFEEAPGGWKHFGECDAASGAWAQLEAWLEGHYRAGNTVSYAFLEFPSNPIIVSLDLKRLRELADKYAFPVFIDDTIGSFANIDVLPLADLLITSLTKSFSGYADVMGGSIALNPLAPAYPELKALFTTHHHNELFAGDAATLLANSSDYLARTHTLNRNAAALAAHLHTHATTTSPTSTTSPIKRVWYPTTHASQPNYDAVLRRATAALTPGYGCLLSVDLATPRAARAFYDALPAHNGPHLGAHRMLALPFNQLVLGKFPAAYAYHAAYGAHLDQVRVSVGLEEEREVIAAAAVALEAAVRAMEGEGENGGLEGVREGEAEGVGFVEVEVEDIAKGTSANFE